MLCIVKMKETGPLQASNEPIFSSSLAGGMLFAFNEVNDPQSTDH